jgi:hypothetical protein
MEAWIGANQCGALRAGSNGPPPIAIARSGAATATTAMCIVMCAAKNSRANAGNGPSQAAASVMTPNKKLARRISNTGR